jgi:hypothetical protein
VSVGFIVNSRSNQSDGEEDIPPEPQFPFGNNTVVSAATTTTTTTTNASQIPTISTLSNDPVVAKTSNDITPGNATGKRKKID